MKLTTTDQTAQLRRRTLIDMALRRQRAGTGSLVREGNPPQPWIRWPDLTRVFGEIPWAVAGAVATRLYMSERMTRDLDILIRVQDAAAVAVRLAEAGYTQAGRLTIGGSSWLSPEGIPLDVIEGEDTWVADALARARHNLDSQGLPVLALPYLVLMKISASRLQDIPDVARMLGRANEVLLEETRGVVQQYATDLVEDLESLIYLGKLELGDA